MMRSTNPEWREWEKTKYHKRRARIEGNGGAHTTAEWLAMCAEHNHQCASCHEEKPLTRDHKIPLSRAGQTTLATFSLYVALAIPAREQNLYMDFKLQNELRDAGYNGGFLLEELIEAIIKEKSNTFSVYFNGEWPLRRTE